jgi:hypothetical protein
MSLESWFPEEIERPALERKGVRAKVPDGWECRIAQLSESGEGERSFQVLHAATVPLTGERADYGGGVVERLGPEDVFISLIEFGPEEASTALFKVVDELPTLELGMFHRNQLQRRIRGQAGKQHFFTLNGRPFCLYVVLGSVAHAPALVAKANEMLRGMSVAAIEPTE